MNRLVVFGGSMSYGHGLEDCQDNNGGATPGPSKLAWPNLLGNLLNLEVINTGILGASNLEILYEILNFKFHPQDLVVIEWVYSHRNAIFTDLDKFNRIEKTSKSFENMLLVHTDIDLKMRALFYIHHAECFLKTLKIKSFNYFIPMAENLKLYGIPKYLNIEHLNFPNIDYIDFGADGYHPGPLTHKRYALSFYKDIQKYND